MEDWRADLNPAMKVMENPICDLRDKFPTIQIHDGFYEYLHKHQLSEHQDTINEPRIPVFPNHLFSPTLGEAIGLEKVEEAPTKYQVILEQVAAVFHDYPEYAFYTTGHSLGGALATLFAFEVACLKSSEIPNLITCINFASPKVGNIHFSRAIDYLEKKGVLRHVRITNQYDPVPRLPLRAYVNDLCLLCRMKNMYVHVGFKVELKPGKKLRVKHAPKFDAFQQEYFIFILRRYARMCLNVAFCLIAGNVNALRYHSCLDYYELIRKTKERLQKLDLDEMYARRSDG